MAWVLSARQFSFALNYTTTMKDNTKNSRTIGSLVDQNKSIDELKALLDNWQSTYNLEFDVLTEPTKALMLFKIDEVKELIEIKLTNQ